MKLSLITILFLSSFITFSQSDSLRALVEIEVIEDSLSENEVIVPSFPIVIYNLCASTAEFIGGDVCMKHFIVNNLIYPSEARKNGEQGTVYVEFTIKKDGQLTDVKIVKGVSESLDKEAIRLIKIMPRWIAAERSDKLLESSVILPITFILK